MLVLALADPVSLQPLASFPRYELVIFPMFIWAAQAHHAPQSDVPAISCLGGAAGPVHRRVRDLALGRMSQAVLLDAFGTLVTLDAPAPLLRALLRERLGVEVTEAQAAAGAAAEVGYYRAHMHEGVDIASASPTSTRVAPRCWAAALPRSPQLDGAATPATITGSCSTPCGSAVFPEVPEALARLRAAGLRLVVASNWDASLDSVLDRVGLLEAVDGVVTRRRRCRQARRRACSRARCCSPAWRPTQALHVGDSFREDVGAALAPGVRPVLIARDGRAGEVERGSEAPTIPELA